MEHSDHKRVYPEDVAAKEKESLMETLQEAEDAITKLEAAITSRDDMKKLIEIQKNEVNEKIAQEFKMIYSSLQEREKALHSKCEEFANQKLTVLSIGDGRAIDNLKRSLTFSTQTASGVENLSPAELLGTQFCYGLVYCSFVDNNRNVITLTRLKFQLSKRCQPILKVLLDGFLGT